MLSKSTVTGKHFWRGKEIPETEYLHILSVIENKPSPPEGFGYRLTDALEWELYELPAPEETEELSETEEKAKAYDILMGVAT